MHSAAFNYFAKIAKNTDNNLDIVEFGSLDINVGIKNLFQYKKYVGVDISPGPGVDIVCDASEWVADQEYDVVLCAEVFEHTERWPEICENAYNSLKCGGRFIGSCASIGRAPHSAIDGGEVRIFEHYENVPSSEMQEVLSRQGWENIEIQYNEIDGDLYFTAVKP